MSYFSGICILVLNLGLAVYIAGKARMIRELQRQSLENREQLGRMMAENNRIFMSIIGELEKWIDTAAGSQKAAPPQTAALNTCQSIDHLRNQGLTTREIAEKMKIAQGEVMLKINLSEIAEAGKNLL